MARIKAKDLREMNEQELRARAAELERDIFKRRLQKALGQLEKPIQVRALRRDYARVLTILRERAAATARRTA